jgi:hypothetical protein
MTDNPRAVSMIAWCVLVLAGVLVLTFCSDRGTKLAAVAKRFLPMNTLLLADYVDQPVFVNRYVVAPHGVQKGARLRPDDVADVPLLPEISPASLLLSLAVPRTDVAKGINAKLRRFASPHCGIGTNGPTLAAFFGINPVTQSRSDWSLACRTKH